MLALCFPVLISLALAAPGVSRNCYSYCKSQKPELMKDDPLLDCNCADLITTAIEAKELTTVTLDDTGVYFVPAELQVSQEQFASQPFVILNPAKLVPKSGTSRINRQFDAKEDPLDDLIPSQSRHVEIHERTETISHTSINQEVRRKTPLYLDLELEDTNGNERAAVHKSTLIDDFESTEEALIECLDYQVVHYTRKYGFIIEFKEFWEARNLNKYKDVPNLEIEEKIKEYCSKPEAIVQQSLHEIKQGIPKKGPDSKSIFKNKNEVREVDNTTEIHKNLLADITNSGNTSSLITSTSLFDNATGTDQSDTYKTSTENYIVSENATDLYDITIDPSENWPFLTFVNSNQSSILNKENNNEKHQNSTPSKVTDSGTEMSTENISTVDNQEKHIIPANQKNRVSERESEIDSDMASMGSEDVFHTDRPIKLTQAPTTGEPILDKITSSLRLPSTEETLTKITATKEESTEEYLSKGYATKEVSTEGYLSKGYATTEVNTEENLGIEYATTEVNISDQLSNNNTTHIVVTSGFSHVRGTYTEKEIKIPKITTTECQNHTVYSAISGTEELPNDDFTDSTTGESGYSETRKLNRNIENYITGKLYFVSKTELVPVRFVQTNTGAINLGIDGVALCDKLVRKTNKSRLLAHLCDYMENV